MGTNQYFLSFSLSPSSIAIKLSLSLSLFLLSFFSCSHSVFSILINFIFTSDSSIPSNWLHTFLKIFLILCAVCQCYCCRAYVTLCYTLRAHVMFCLYCCCYVLLHIFFVFRQTYTSSKRVCIIPPNGILIFILQFE